MATLGEAKTLGVIGSILGLLTFVPTVGGVLGIVGFILVLVAVNYISNIVGDRTIFKNMIISVILGIAGIIVFGVTVAGAIFRFIGLSAISGSFTGLEGWTPSLGEFPSGSFPPLSGNLLTLIAGVIIGLVVMYVFILISAIFLRRSYNSIGEKLNIKMFRTAGLLYLIGAALTIVLVGFALILVAEILLVVAFFSIKPESAAASQSAAPQRFCTSCGRAVPADPKFCPHCGKELPP